MSRNTTKKLKTLFIGSFPKETKGGSSTASILLLETSQFNGNHIIKLDSTLDDISDNRFASRVFRAFKRLIRLTIILFRDRPNNALIFCGHGWGFIEKGVMVHYMKWFGVESVLAPNSGLILQSLKRKRFERFVSRVFNRCKHVICQGQYWKDLFSEYVEDPSRLVIVRNWLGEDTITDPIPPFSMPPRDEINLVYLGWLERYKGISDLLEACHICKQKGTKIRLDIWGEGSTRDEIQVQIERLGLQQDVKLKGWANEADKQQIYGDQPILVLPSYYEGMPNVVLEGMAHGLPVIATEISTLPEMVDHNVNGLLCPPKKPEELAQAILNLGLDHLKRQEIREKAKLAVSGLESWRAAEHLVRLLNDKVQVAGKPRLLILSDWFEPAYKGGGPITSCYNFCFHFNQEFDIQVITSNSDFKSDKPLPVEKDRWVTKPYGIQVFYASGIVRYLQRLVVRRKHQPDIIYLQGVFSLKFGILPLVLAKIGLLRSQFIVAPRGMLQSGAIEQKTGKKVLYLAFARFFGLFRKIHFQATDQTEKLDIHEHTRVSKEQISVLPNFPNVFNEQGKKNAFRIKNSGDVRLVYYSRISPKKNLEFYLDVLNYSFNGYVDLAIIGPIEEESYWKELKGKIEQLPDNVNVEYLGAMPLQQSLNKMKEFHFMVLPTLGENYGHVIVEAFSVGLPVIVSDQTPWRDLESKQLGWDLELDMDIFRKNLVQIISMTNSNYTEFCTAALNYVETEIKPEIKDLKNQYETVLNKIII
ncbi:MAG: glycosyltransferase [Bacteroidia bacterium]|nr:glycosyltransferase [Bacteroidia bacterium]